MSEKKTKQERKGQPKYTQEQKATFECIRFVQGRMSGRPVLIALSILADMTLNILNGIEAQTKVGSGEIVRQFAALLMGISQPNEDSGESDVAECESTEMPVGEPEATKPAPAIVE